jgi:hypothetical protein
MAPATTFRNSRRRSFMAYLCWSTLTFGYGNDTLVFVSMATKDAARRCAQNPAHCKLGFEASRSKRLALPPGSKGPSPGFAGQGWSQRRVTAYYPSRLIAPDATRLRRNRAARGMLPGFSFGVRVPVQHLRAHAPATVPTNSP